MLLRPDDLDLASLSSATDIGTLKRVIHESLLGSVAVQLGTLISGGLLSKDAAKLHKAAVAKGTKSKDFVEKALAALTSLPIKLKGLDVAGIARRIAGGSHDSPTAKAIAEHIERHHAIAYLFVRRYQSGGLAGGHSPFE